MAPYDIIVSLGKFGGYLVFLLIGAGFGAVLEMSGFGDSRKLAAQFYFKDMTVLKVMFTAIIVCMVMIFAATSLELMDFNQVFVLPTFLVPGIIGGIIMGVGFIIGGFCPGTSIVSMATFKIDGIIFAIGVAAGAMLFGETIPLLQGFHNSTYMGRFILPQLFGLETGTVVLLVVIMALIMFYWAEISEAYFGRKTPWMHISLWPSDRKKMIASAALVMAALFVIFSGQPDAAKKWEWIREKEEQNLTKRLVYIHPGELLEVMNDPMLYTRLLDVRSETDYNLFHLENARRIALEALSGAASLPFLQDLPPNMVIVVMSNNETAATTAFKMLRAEGIINIYILEGGVNNWLKYFPAEPETATPLEAPSPGIPGGDESLRFIFRQAVGSMTKNANPGPEAFLSGRSISFEKKVKIQRKKIMAGSCG